MVTSFLPGNCYIKQALDSKQSFEPSNKSTCYSTKDQRGKPIRCTNCVSKEAWLSLLTLEDLCLYCLNPLIYLYRQGEEYLVRNKLIADLSNLRNGKDCGLSDIY